MTANTIGELHPSLVTAKTRPLFAMRLSARMTPIGATPGCMRRVSAITGGFFEGERLSGDVLDGGNDWQTIRSDGAITLDVRIALKTRDDALITMAYRGLRHGPPEVLARLDRGEVVEPTEYYFRVFGNFETASPKYDWLNRLFAVGSGHRLPDGPIYSIFELL